MVVGVQPAKDGTLPPPRAPAFLEKLGTYTTQNKLGGIIKPVDTL